MTTIYTPFVGFSDLDTSDAALMADAHATAAEHADRLYRRFQAHALCEWQQPVCDAPVDIPDEDDPTEGDEPPIDWGNDRTPAAPRMSLSSPAPSSAVNDNAASVVDLYPDGPYFTNAARGQLFYVNPRFGCIARGTFRRDRVARIAATLNAMRWPDA